MKIKRNIILKALLVLFIIFLMQLTYESFLNYRPSKASFYLSIQRPDGTFYRINYLSFLIFGILELIYSYFIILTLVIEPIYNKKYKAFINRIPLENISNYNTNVINSKKQTVSPALLHYPKMLMPFEEVSKYINKTKNCTTHIYNEGLVIRFSGTLFNSKKNPYDYVIPYEDIESCKIKPLKIMFTNHKSLLINLSNGNKIILLYNQFDLTEINYISKSLTQKIEDKTKANEENIDKKD